MRQERRQRTGGHAFNARRLAERDGPSARKLLAHFGGETANAGVVEIGIEAKVLVALEGFDVERLAIEIARIHRVDLDLLARLARERTEFGPDGCELREADRRV